MPKVSQPVRAEPRVRSDPVSSSHHTALPAGAHDPRPLILTRSHLLGVAPVDISAGLLDDNIGTLSGC